MKIAATVSRYLLGILFTVFGLNGFLHFIPAQPMGSPLAMQFVTALMASHYMTFVFLVQLIGGVLLLANRFVPFALTILAPVIVNILLFHTLMNPEGLLPGALATVFWLLVFMSVRHAFDGIFQATPSATATPSRYAEGSLTQAT